MRSPAEVLASLPEEERQARIAALPEVDLRRLYKSWRFWARSEQIPPVGSWRWWGYLAGRRAGKTRSASEWVIDRAEKFAVARWDHYVGTVNRTFDDVRVINVDGPSGLKACAERRGYRFHHPPTALEASLVIPTDYGEHTSHIELHTADRPDRIRGRGFHTLWLDEFAAYRLIMDEHGGTVFTNGDLALSAICPPGMHPQGAMTSTPKPVKLVKDLLNGQLGETTLSASTLFDNVAWLDPNFVAAMRARYEGTTLGNQELLGMLMESVEGAGWDMECLEATRVRGAPPELAQLVISVDPSGTKGGNECGIVAVGTDAEPADWTRRDVFVVGDASGNLAPDEWGRAAVDLFYELRANTIVAETNFGADMVRTIIHMIDPNVPFEPVHASRGKDVRAEPVAALWGATQRRGHIIGVLPELESELTTWVLGDKSWSPNRLDAMVHGCHHLLPGLSSAPTTAYGQWISEQRLEA